MPIQSILLLIVFCIGVFQFQIKGVEIKNLIIYLFISTFFDLVQWITALNSLPNRFISNFKDIFEFLAIVFLYYYLLKSTKVKKWVVIVLGFVSMFFFILNFNWEEVAGYAVALNRICIAIYVLLFLHTLLSDYAIENILLYSPFWMAAGFMFFSFGSIFINLFWISGISLNADKNTYRLSQSIELIIQIISLILWAVAIIIDKPKQQNG